MNEATSILLLTHSIYPVVLEDLYLHLKPSLSMDRLLLMYFVVEYSRQLGLFQMIHYPVMIRWIDAIIQCWQYEVEIQTLIKNNSVYTTRDNAEVELHDAVSFVLVST